MEDKSELSIGAVLFKTLKGPSASKEMPLRYKKMLRNLRVMVLFVALLPLTVITVLGFLQYHRAIFADAIAPINTIAARTRHSFELFLEERLNLLRLISSSYDINTLCNNKNLENILSLLRSEFGGFVDLGFINGETGLQVTYSGPYDLKGKNYSEQSWFHEVLINKSYISDVFLGYRKFPHFAMAVLKRAPDGTVWILRATFNTARFEDIIAGMGLGPDADAFVINKERVLQTKSRIFGDILATVPLKIPKEAHSGVLMEYEDKDEKGYFVSISYIPNTNFYLTILIPKSSVMKSWMTLRTDIALTYFISVLIILISIYRITSGMVISLMESDKKREIAFRELEHSHKLTSIGRLAAGVAHEINNPLAVINEKAGLMKDLIEKGEGLEDKAKFLNLINSIRSSVERCKTITHRLLGFARKMDVSLEQIDVNEILKEVVDFVAKEAMYRNIVIDFQLSENLPKIYSDKGRLQQAFLNIITNAIQAISSENGTVTITTWIQDPETVGISIKDNGIGMSEEVLRHIFEPFFTTKKGYGTGLGLPITYGIVTKLGGNIRVESKEGIGTTFYVYLPIKPKEGAINDY